MNKTRRPKITPFIFRILLGLIYTFFGLDYFLHFTHSGPPDPTTKAGNFLGALSASGYFFAVLKSLEVIYGLLLLANWFVPLILILLFPISIQILLFNSFLAHSIQPLIISIIIIFSNTFLAWSYRHVYAPLFRQKNQL
jgi:putative oxidoreductase